MSNPQTDHDAAAIADFEASVGHALRRLGVVRSPILIAVSGGADSTALLHALARIRPAGLEVATLDHGLRAGSADEARGVAERCARLGLPCHVRPLNLAAGPALEQRARDARYAALEQLRAQQGLAAIATAHTASDQAETVLMRLSRGAALGGAAGILARRGAIVRPLLQRTRAEVIGYLRALREAWVEDPTNGDPAFLRNRIRAEALPALEQAAGPGVAQRLAQFAALAADDDAFLEAEAAAALSRIARDGTLDALAVDALALPVRRRVIASWLRGNEVVVDAALVEDVVAAVGEGRQATVPGDRVLAHDGGFVKLQEARGRRGR